MAGPRAAAAVLLTVLALLSTPAAVAKDTLADLMLDLQIIPLDGPKAPPFTLATLDGRRVALADLTGRAVLLYFWATW